MSAVQPPPEFGEFWLDMALGLAFGDDGLSCASAQKSSRTGRPLGAKAVAIREAVLELPDVYKRMSVRQVYYSLVSRGVIPKDESAGYRPVQTQVLKLRREELLPWEFIADGTRWMRKPPTWDSVEDAMTHMARTYRRNLWQRQGVRIEVWLEKDALADVLLDVTQKWDVPLMVSRGTSSVTFIRNAAVEAIAAADHGVRTVILALYDFDAGGARTARQIQRGFEEHGADVEFKLLALTDAQRKRWKLPTRPASKKDPEAKKWRAKYGDVAVELDAIPPDKLTKLAEDAIVGHVDADAWRAEQVIEEEERRGFEALRVEGLPSGEDA